MESESKRITFIDPDEGQPISRSLEDIIGNKLKAAGIDYNILGNLAIPEESYQSPPKLFIIGYPEHSSEATWEDDLLRVFRATDSPFKKTKVAVYHSNPSPGFEAVMKQNGILIFEQIDDLNHEKIVNDIIGLANE